jgi:hypothetical protein
MKETTCKIKALMAEKFSNQNGWEDMYWIHIALDSNKWQALVAMILLVL